MTRCGWCGGSRRPSASSRCPPASGRRRCSPPTRWRTRGRRPPRRPPRPAGGRPERVGLGGRDLPRSRASRPWPARRGHRARRSPFRPSANLAVAAPGPLDEGRRPAGWGSAGGVLGGADPRRHPPCEPADPPDLRLTWASASGLYWATTCLPDATAEPLVRPAHRAAAPELAGRPGRLPVAPSSRSPGQSPPPPSRSSRSPDSRTSRRTPGGVDDGGVGVDHRGPAPCARPHGSVRTVGAGERGHPEQSDPSEGEHDDPLDVGTQGRNDRGQDDDHGQAHGQQQVESLSADAEEPERALRRSRPGRRGRWPHRSAHLRWRHGRRCQRR